MAEFNEFDLECMKRAIDEARKCQSEDAQPRPRVGVVVAREGQILAVGHRGEISMGEHAEYTVLEKKLERESLAGATIFTTLEPCTTRNHPKVPCAERLVERRVDRVVIGMLDPNPEICGRGQRRLRDAKTTTEFFPAELASEVEELNREFERAIKAVARARELRRRRLAFAGCLAALALGGVASFHLIDGSRRDRQADESHALHVPPTAEPSAAPRDQSALEPGAGQLEPARGDIRLLFPTSIRYHVESRLPVVSELLPRVGVLAFEVAEAPARLRRDAPEHLFGENDEVGDRLYHEYLQWALLQALASVYRASWQVEILRTGPVASGSMLTTSAPGTAESSRRFSNEELSEALAGNRFAGMRIGLSPALALPPGSALSIVAAPSERESLTRGEIRFSNEHYAAVIETRLVTWQRGLGGLEGVLGVSPEEAELLGTATYSVRIRIDLLETIPPLERPTYAEWASQLSGFLQEQFDDQRLLESLEERRRLLGG